MLITSFPIQTEYGRNVFPDLTVRDNLDLRNGSNAVDAAT